MSLHKTLKVKDDQRLFFIGDIHGCWMQVEKLLDSVGFDRDSDILVCVGDLIDRGTQNFMVLNKFLHNPAFHTVRGNHDQFMIAGDYYNWMYNGGMWANEVDPEIIKDLAKEMDSKFPYFMSVEYKGRKYGVVHAGIPFRYPQDGGVDPLTPVWDDVIKGDSVWDMGSFVWDRDVIKEIMLHLWRADNSWDFMYNMAKFNGPLVNVPSVEGVDYVFHGHTYVPKPVVWGNRVYLDTGGVFKGTFTIAEVTDDGLVFTTSEA